MENFRFVGKALPESVENARRLFNLSSEVYEMYLDSELYSHLENLLRRDTDWLRILYNPNENIDNLLNQNFNLLSERLQTFKGLIDLQFQCKTKEFYENKSNSAQELDETTYECFICLIVIFTSKSSDKNLNSLRDFAIESFSSIRKLFDTILLTSKLDKLKDYVQMGFTKEMQWTRANEYLKEHFYMFVPREFDRFPGLIHEQFKGELLFNGSISSPMQVTQFESLIRSFFCSLGAFEQFLQKNFFYFSVQLKLEGQYIFVAQLQKDYPGKEGLRSRLKITESRSAKYKDRIYEFDCRGLQRVLKEGKEVKLVRRSEPDYMVFIGSDRSSSFVSDIQVSVEDSPTPNAVVFINRHGLNIIDISPLWSVKVQFSTRVIDKSTILVFGRSTFINIQPFDGVCITENLKRREKTLIFYQYNSGEFNFVAKHFVCFIVPGGEIRIGKVPGCQVGLEATDISDVHAVVKLGEKGEIMIEDRSKGNSFFVLKNKRQVIKGKISKFCNLRKNPDFCVKNVRFKLID